MRSCGAWPSAAPQSGTRLHTTRERSVTSRWLMSKSGSTTPLSWEPRMSACSPVTPTDCRLRMLSGIASRSWRKLGSTPANRGYFWESKITVESSPRRTVFWKSSRPQKVNGWVSIWIQETFTRTTCTGTLTAACHMLSTCNSRWKFDHAVPSRKVWLT